MKAPSTYSRISRLFLWLSLLPFFSFAQNGNTPDYRAYLTQKIDVSAHRGKKFRLQAKVKVERDVSQGSAEVVAVIYDEAEKNIGSYFMRDRPIVASQWDTYAHEGVLSPAADSLLLGAALVNSGVFYLDDFELSVANAVGGWDQLAIENGGFESGLKEAGTPLGWEGTVTRRKEYQITLTEGPSGNNNRALRIEKFTPYPRMERFEHFTDEQGLAANRVYDIVQDSLGFLWFATEAGLSKYDGYRFTNYRHDPEDTNSLSNNLVFSLARGKGNILWVGTLNGLNRFDPGKGYFELIRSAKKDSLIGPIHAITEDRNGFVWYVNAWNGLNRLNLHDGSITLFQTDLENQHSIHGRQSVHILEDTSGNIWLGTPSGLNRFDPSKQEFYRYPIEPERHTSPLDRAINGIALDPQGELMVTSGKSLYRYDALKDKFNKLSDRHYEKIVFDQSGNIWSASWDSRVKRVNLYLEKIDSFFNDPRNSYSHSTNGANTMLVDRENTFWSGTDLSGVNKYSPIKEKFYHYQSNPFDPSSLNHDAILKIIEDHQGGVWVGTFGGGLNYLNPHTQTFKKYFYSPEATTSRGDNSVACIFEDSNKFIWIGTGKGNLYRFDPLTKIFSKFSAAESDDPQSAVYLIDIFEDSNKTLWLGTNRGLSAFNRATEEFSPILEPGTADHAVARIWEPEPSRLWLGISSGIVQFDTRSKKFTPLNFGIELPNKILKRADGKIWVGSPVGLHLVDPVTQKVLDHLTTKDGLVENSISDILSDDHGRLWISGSLGISELDLQTNAIRNFNLEDGLQSYEFNSGAFKSPRTGRMYFGGVKGFNVFHPDSVLINSHIPPVVFTRCLRYNKRDSLGLAIEVPGISYQKEVTFSFRDDILTFEFAALSYVKPEKNQYEYMLEGFNDRFIPLGTKREVSFTDLAPGTYTLKVKGANGDGVWNPDPATLRLIITPPWYWAGWSKTLYLLAILAGIYYFYRFQLNRRLAQAETLRLRELDQVKTKLYTNITHEFRTPLTVIQGVTDQIESRAKAKSDDVQQSNARIVKRNSAQLLSLVNQMLDLRKLESGNLPVRLIQGDIVVYLKYLLESFHSLAENKDIRLHFLAKEKELVMDYDPEKIRHIMANLLSNAVKFTPEGGDVYVSVDSRQSAVGSRGDMVDGSLLKISVKDTGIGIPADKLPHIFDRFYQVDDASTRKAEGTGIGLTLTKELVKLLEGEIRAESEPGRGSTFEVNLPIRNTAPRTKEVPEIDTPLTTATVAAGMGAATEVVPALVGTSELPLALIVEDNRDVANYISSCLEGHYRVALAANGQAGIDKAIESVPDLIISDVMMPEKDGFEVTQTLKNDPHTSHIPIILLTARADIQSKLQGLERGADAYLPKPFNQEELLIRSRKLLELRQKLQVRYLAMAGSAAATPVPEEQPEDAFVLRVRETVENYLTDFDFSVEQLADEMHMSRSQLHRKLSALTGYSTSRFIRYIRLNHAKALLQDPELPIGNIAYDSGFSDPVYFTRVFKQEFGRTPTEWREREQ